MNASRSNISVIFSQLARLWLHLDSRRRRQVGLVFLLMLVSALSEIVTLGAVLPFLGALSAPERVMNQPMVAVMAAAWGITSGEQLVLPLAVLFAVSALIAGAIRLLLLWANNRLAFAAERIESGDEGRHSAVIPGNGRMSPFGLSWMPHSTGQMLASVKRPFGSMSRASKA